VKRLLTIVTLAILLVGLILFSLNDNDISVAYTCASNSEVASSRTDNSSATATITITMTGAFNSYTFNH